MIDRTAAIGRFATWRLPTQSGHSATTGAQIRGVAYVAELLVETLGLAAAGVSKPTIPTTRPTQIAIAVTAKNPDSSDIFFRLIMVVSVCLRAGGIRPPDGDHSRLLIVRTRRCLTQRFCAKCTFRRPGGCCVRPAIVQ